MSNNRLSPWESSYREHKVESMSLQEQLDWLQTTILSHDHHSRTPTTFYGSGDPRVAHIARCRCSPAEDTVTIHTARMAVTTYNVSCKTCEKKTPPLASALKAVFAWNLSNNAIEPNYREIPYFALVRFDPLGAKDRLERIIDDIQLRLEISAVKRRLGEGPISRGYDDRLHAYREHAQYALSLVKRELNQYPAANSA